MYFQCRWCRKKVEPPVNALKFEKPPIWEVCDYRLHVTAQVYMPLYCPFCMSMLAEASTPWQTSEYNLHDDCASEVYQIVDFDLLVTEVLIPLGGEPAYNILGLVWLVCVECDDPRQVHQCVRLMRSQFTLTFPC
jgi:hypothetical protein